MIRKIDPNDTRDEFKTPTNEIHEFEDECQTNVK